MRIFAILGAAIMLATVPVPTPAQAEVASADAGGFILSSSIEVAATPADAYRMLIAPNRWWIAAHSYSGDAANLSLDPRAGGCFCEKLKDGGSIEHGRVIYAQPGKVLRIDAALGPLQQEAVTGRLTFTLEPAGQGTRISMRYAVGGYRKDGLAPLASIVDRVMGEQLASLGKAIAASAK